MRVLLRPFPPHDSGRVQRAPTLTHNDGRVQRAPTLTHNDGRVQRAPIAYDKLPLALAHGVARQSP
ncbi:hypothetical protein F1C16_13095 [Hymenobacter sp. NBH84]|uniref:hypothetical protein n=1 Tax=Hymenobacter sp. NBH84 TaxID=2596915 RepID=UPI00162AEEA5|nr:hypothetical protein [Hymenobacter sp. NBH84]QNE40427.1 hypothetical protein F1C16_13095 [Hymenobacter sp. NBH84]